MKTEKGLTLIELIIAIAVTGIILGIIYSAYFNVISVLKSCQENNKDYKIACNIFDKIRDDLNGVYFSQASAVKFFGQKESMEFLSTNTWGLSEDSQAGLQPIKYRLDRLSGSFLEEENSVKGDSLYRQEHGNNICLGDCFYGLEFSYYDGKDWLAQWDTDWMGRLPLGVKVVIFVQTQPKITRKFSAVFEIPCAY